MRVVAKSLIFSYDDSAFLQFKRRLAIPDELVPMGKHSGGIQLQADGL